MPSILMLVGCRIQQILRNRAQPDGSVLPPTVGHCVVQPAIFGLLQGRAESIVVASLFHSGYKQNANGNDDAGNSQVCWSEQRLRLWAAWPTPARPGGTTT